MKGILFKPEMVCAILEGRKTQTRRLIKDEWPYGFMACAYSGTGWAYKAPDGSCTCSPLPVRYHPGEVVYVKEGLTRSGGLIQYRTDGKTSNHIWPAKWKQDPRSSLLCPEWAARIKLRIIEVTAQRLQDITEADVEAEGIKVTIGTGMIDSEKCYHFTNCTGYTRIASQAYSELWDSINRAHPWDSNPWVFAYTFEINNRRMV